MNKIEIYKQKKKQFLIKRKSHGQKTDKTNKNVYQIEL